MSTEPRDTASTPTLHLTRWTVTSGSNSRSRGAVVVTAGDHQWRASSDGNGAIDALFRAVDAALSDVLAGHPRLLGFDIHALGEGTDADGLVSVRVAPPAAAGQRGSGEYTGAARGPNTIAASIEAYVMALDAMLSEAHWRGAPEAAASVGTRARRRSPVANVEARKRRADIDEGEGHHDTTGWFER